MKSTSVVPASQMSFRFGENFMVHYAGHLISDPGVALVELVANAYDAGATEVLITWPAALLGDFEIRDNGTGMTRAQFESRWRVLSYSRAAEQGPNIEYPDDFPHSKASRPAFGRNGQGRLGAFCFSDSYEVETWRDGQCTTATVAITRNQTYPFEYRITATSPRDGHGTIIRAQVKKTCIPCDSVTTTIGSKFAVIPWLAITVNGRVIELTDLSGASPQEIEVPEYDQRVVIHTIGTDKRDRTTFLRGIAWWVNGRMVGEPTWASFEDEGAFLDGRSHLAGSCSFIVKADDLQDAVKGDWSGFHDTPASLAVRQRVHGFVLDALRKLDAGTRKQKKATAVQQNRARLVELPDTRRSLIGQFIDGLLEQCPSLSERDLARVVHVFTNLEASSRGFDLLKRLAQCSPEDLDTWERIMGEWSAAEAAIVLDELGRRLKLLSRLQTIVNDRQADELHEIHPLIASGLWIFGPEFEAVDFLSNRALCTVMAKLLDTEVGAENASRPDLVILPGRSLTVHSCDSFDERAEVSGLAKVVIVELKRGGARVGEQEVFQGQKYANHLRRESAVQANTQIVVHVLGSQVDSYVTEQRTDEDRTIVRPQSYDEVIRRAQARTFHLDQRLRKVAPASVLDPEIEAVLSAAPPRLPEV